MKALLAALAVLMIAVPASAQFAVAGGSSFDYVKTSETGEWEDVTTPMAKVAYILGMESNSADELVSGLSIGLRGTDGADLITEYSIGYWAVTDYFEWFVDAVMPVWGDGFTGSKEFLGGGRVGIRGSAIGGAPVEASVMYAGGAEGKGQVSVFVGLHVEG